MQREHVTESILQRLAEIRRSIPRKKVARPAERSSRMKALTMEAFEAEAIAEALETMAAELKAALDEAEAKLFEQALDAYYVAEELARSPEHPELVPHVEKMRQAYERSYGHAIPTREETEARRRTKGPPPRSVP